MSVTTHQRRLRQAAAMRLLQGDPPANEMEARVAALLAAASAPRLSDVDGREAVAREHMAMAAFRDAPALTARSRSRTARRTTLARLVTIKAGIVVAAVLGLGGVAVAATTGNLPGVTHSGATQSSNAPGSVRPRPAQPASMAPGTKVPPGLWWLCNNYIGRNAEQRGKALGDPAFKDLVNNAGNDRDRVDAYCTKMLQHGPDGMADAHPTHPGVDARPHPSHPAVGKPSMQPGKG
jgi:hypothetical protein